ncbi:hypothetical protein F4781DRAFT_408905 [Annulohypoxylon bovei var. microspora]|nr:hypothetical protein F4781DRAFT_408905 [Annulohypoxylon bovei var. microspora]
MYPDGDLEAWEGEGAAYSEIVRALLPFAELTETIAARPSPPARRSTRITSRFTTSFPTYADNIVFPRLSTVLVTVQRLEWDNTGTLPPPSEPRPLWSVRLLDIYTHGLHEQLKVEFGDLDLTRSRRLMHESKQRAKTRRLVWESEDEMILLATAQDQEFLSKLDAVTMWLRASHYLRKEFTGLESGDRIYLDYRDLYYKVMYDKALHTEMAEVRSTGALPLFNPVVRVHKAPLI